MQVENRGASCETCAHNGKSKPVPTACWLCYRLEGYPGWEPAPGVKVKETRYQVWRAGTFAPVPVLVREVI